MANDINSLLLQFLLYVLLLSVVSIASVVFLGLSVYNDARVRCNSNAVMWGVLSTFFWIAAIIYLCVRSSQKFVTCLQCRQVYPANFPACPTCGLPSPNAYLMGTPEQQERWKKRRRLFLILFIVALALTIIAGIVLFGWYFTSIMDITQSSQHHYYY
jgi:uncharacterized BrkB/YihY/UPF0761 family membrane protein